MNRIAYIYGETLIYWSSIILTLATVSAIFLFVAFCLYKFKSGVAAAVAVPLSIVLSLVFARMLHWYCRADSYLSFGAAMTDYFSGGYALLGVFAGCALAAVIVRALKLTDNLPGLLDCMSLAGCCGIAVGRLACFFNSQDRGQIIASVQGLPWVYPVINTVSGTQEFRLATFVIQAMVTAVIFLVLMLLTRVPGKRRKEGDLTLIFLLLYGASQVVLDSTRYDSLFFRSNGFVSIVQVFSALALGMVCVLFSVRLVKRHGFERRYAALWLEFVALVGLGGYMEYHVQRHGDQAAFAYSCMSGALVGVVAIVMGIWYLAGKEPVTTVYEELLTGDPATPKAETVKEAPVAEIVVDSAVTETVVPEKEASEEAAPEQTASQQTENEKTEE